MEVFRQFARRPFSFFLDSGMDHAKLGRFSFMGADPFLVVKSGQDSDIASQTSTFDSIKPGREPGSATGILKGDPFGDLRDTLSAYEIGPGPYPVPFVGGAVGFLSYDLGRQIEHIETRAQNDLQLPDLCFGLYDLVLAFDHADHSVWIASTGFPEQNGASRLRRAKSRIEELKRLLHDHTKGDDCKAGERANIISGVRSNFTREEYLKAVERARRYIIDGDIFEVNLSQRFEADPLVDPLQLYCRLRGINPAPFASYLGFDEVKVIGASPERFLRKTGPLVETRPIKGTRRRGKDAQEDRFLASELTSSIKDNAENMMIVDLERNDLGRVCQYGSVQVTELAILETYPTVFHLTSTVQGMLEPGKDSFDLLRATFPGGSITGAPKVRAMQIIEELEPTRRSLYTGSVGYLGFDGNLDLNIVIRTILATENRTYFQAGGAVVFDSDPLEEYQETLDKASAMFRALDQTPQEGSLW